MSALGRSAHRVKLRDALVEPLLLIGTIFMQLQLGPENRLVGTLLAEYALLLRKTKRKNEAKQMEVRALAIRKGHALEDLGRHTIDHRDLLVSKHKRSADNR